MIEFRSITKSYKEGVNAVDNLCLKLQGGRIFGFLGPNGAGKSTTIKMLVGILNPTEGDILLDGKSIFSDMVAFKRKLAYVPDEPSFYQNITGYEYLNFIADIFRVSSADRKSGIEKYAALFEIENALSDKVNTYSHGMGQKLAIISALVHDPEILVLDEPMVGLDPKASRIVKDIMQERSENGALVFFSTHVLEVAQNICDDIGIIDNGKLLTSGSVSELLDNANDSSLEDFFLKLTEEDGK